jgi:hypothetical protein
MSGKRDEAMVGFDMERAIELTKLGASDEEVVSILGVMPRELTAERKRELKRYRSERSVRLKAKLYELALKGNAQAVLRLIRDGEGGRKVKVKRGKG